MVNAIPQKTKVRTEGTRFEKPSDSFIQVVPQTSMMIPNARSNHCIVGYSLQSLMCSGSLVIRECMHFFTSGGSGYGNAVSTFSRSSIDAFGVKED